LAFQKGFTKTRRQSAGSLRRQDAEQRTARRHPGERPLENPDAEAALPQATHRQGREGAIGVEIGAEQNAT
jgi:hypothetical protein